MVLALLILFYLPFRLSPLAPQHNYVPYMFILHFSGQSCLSLAFLFPLSVWFSSFCTLLTSNILSKRIIQSGTLLRLNRHTIKNYTGSIGTIGIDRDFPGLTEHLVTCSLNSLFLIGDFIKHLPPSDLYMGRNHVLYFSHHLILHA